MNNIIYSEQRDEETEYNYHGARYYDADLLACWLSVDPLADKYPSMSPYNYCAWNPVELVDPDGRDFDLNTENKYIKPYEAELTRRIDYFRSISDRQLTAEEQSQLDECTAAKDEIDKLRKDNDVVYRVNVSKKDLKNTGLGGFLSYGGKEGDQTIININVLTFCGLDDVNDYMGELAHELGHAYQFYSGELVLIKTVQNTWTSNDTKSMEKACHARADMFEKGRINPNYMVNAQIYELPDCYNNYWEDNQAMQVIQYYQKNGGTIYRHK